MTGDLLREDNRIWKTNNILVALSLGQQIPFGGLNHFIKKKRLYVFNSKDAAKEIKYRFVFSAWECHFRYVSRAFEENAINK